jgi:hypothetical protein
VGELEGVSGLQVAQAAAERMGGRPVWWLPTAERACEALGPRLAPGQVFATIGAGDIFELADVLVDNTQRCSFAPYRATKEQRKKVRDDYSS